MSHPLERESVPRVRQLWRNLRSDIEVGMAHLWTTPEAPAMEFKSASYLCDWLEREGFEVTRGYCGVPTAFRAEFGKGGGPSVALLAEYDALPGVVSRVQSPHFNDRLGHGCGHNQIGAANTGAAIAIRRAMEEAGAGGHVIVLGCPAEEIVWGKVALLGRGGFAGVDAILTSHGDYQNGVLSRPCQSVFNGEMVFVGETRHGGGSQAEGVLTALQLAIQSVLSLKSKHFPDVTVRHVIRKGGDLPVVIPGESRVWFSTRHPDFGRAQEVYDFVSGICARAAQDCGIEFREQFISSTRGYLPNDALAECLMRHLEQIGPPNWSVADVAELEELSARARPGAELRLDRSVALYREGVDPYGQDDGEVSWQIPLARINWAAPEAVPLHHWAFTEYSGMQAANAGPLMASEALAACGMELLVDSTILERAKAELKMRSAGNEMPPARYGAFETLTRDPEAFWGGTWNE